MQEDELFDLIKETDQTIAEYEKQNENREESNTISKI